MDVHQDTVGQHAALVCTSCELSFIKHHDFLLIHHAHAVSSLKPMSHYVFSTFCIGRTHMIHNYNANTFTYITHSVFIKLGHFWGSI